MRISARAFNNRIRTTQDKEVLEYVSSANADLKRDEKEIEKLKSVESQKNAEWNQTKALTEEAGAEVEKLGRLLSSGSVCLCACVCLCVCVLLFV